MHLIECLAKATFGEVHWAALASREVFGFTIPATLVERWARFPEDGQPSQAVVVSLVVAALQRKAAINAALAHCDADLLRQARERLAQAPTAPDVPAPPPAP